MEPKLEKLKRILRRMGSVVIAFSGGADSSFLLKVASKVLPQDKVLAVTAVSATYPREELLFAQKIAKSLVVRHKIIRTDELNDKRFIANPPNRCYFCKLELFSRLKNIAKQYKINFVIDATNLSDKSDFRPGNIAKRKLKIRSPLQEAGLVKEEIRQISRKLGLASWNKPSLACLASRIPYGAEISPRVLGRINQAEVYLRRLGFKQVRLRHYDHGCRIEVTNDDLWRLVKNRKQVIAKLKKLGYNYISLDLEGYRSGSMNEVIKNTPYFRAGNV